MLERVRHQVHARPASPRSASSIRARDSGPQSPSHSAPSPDSRTARSAPPTPHALRQRLPVHRLHNEMDVVPHDRVVHQPKPEALPSRPHRPRQRTRAPPRPQVPPPRAPPSSSHERENRFFNSHRFRCASPAAPPILRWPPAPLARTTPPAPAAPAFPIPNRNCLARLILK